MQIGCLWSYSYIKPQLSCCPKSPKWGCLWSYSYIKPQLRPATDMVSRCCLWSYSYIKPQPTSSTPPQHLRCLWSYSYIKPQPVKSELWRSTSCLWSYSYIKPQLGYFRPVVSFVVYGPIPTSNHNDSLRRIEVDVLFMVLFLHQTTTARDSPKLKLCCLWSYSYIKPQLRSALSWCE